MNGTTAEQLLARARQGYRRAFDALQGQLDGRVRSFVTKLIGYHLQTDDVVQDVFLALYLNLERLASTEHLYPFLYRVARNRCYDILRRQGRYQSVPVEDSHAAMLAGPSSSPDVQADWSLLMLEITQAIDQLPELQRQTMILYAEENLTYDQIAAVMNTNIGTVKSRLHNARKALRRIVKAETFNAIDP